GVAAALHARGDGRRGRVGVPADLHHGLVVGEQRDGALPGLAAHRGSANRTGALARGALGVEDAVQEVDVHVAALDVPVSVVDVDVLVPVVAVDQHDRLGVDVEYGAHGGVHGQRLLRDAPHQTASW